MRSSHALWCLRIAVGLGLSAVLARSAAAAPDAVGGAPVPAAPAAPAISAAPAAAPGVGAGAVAGAAAAPAAAPAASSSPSGAAGDPAAAGAAQPSVASLEKGLTLLAERRYEEAYEIFESVASGAPMPPPASPEEVVADRALRRAGVARPTTAPLYVLARFYMAESLFLQGEHHAAHKGYAEILEKHPDFERLAQAIEREHAIGAAFVERKAERPVLGGLFSVKDPDFGVALLEKLIAEYQQPYFDHAELLIADYHFAEADWLRAADAYERLQKDFPASEASDVAEYQSAVCKLRQVKGMRYDLSKVREAEKLLANYVRRRPTGARIREADALLKTVREDLAAQDLEVARFYLERERRPASALIYVESLLRNRRDTAAAEQAKEYLRAIAEQEDDRAAAERAKQVLAGLERGGPAPVGATPGAAGITPEKK